MAETNRDAEPRSRPATPSPRGTSAPTRSRRRARCSRLLGAALARRADRARPSPAASACDAARAAPSPRGEQELLDELRALAQQNQVFRSFIGMGYYDYHHAAGDPAQHPREPGLVHRVHAVPGRDRPGPARGAAQLPDDGRRPDRPADRERLAARRGHRRGRGDEHVPRGRASRGATAFFVAEDCHPQTIAVVQTRAEPLGHRGRTSATGATLDFARRRLFGVLRAVPGHRRRGSSTTRRSRRRRTPRARW